MSSSLTGPSIDQLAGEMACFLLYLLESLEVWAVTYFELMSYFAALPDQKKNLTINVARDYREVK